MLFSKKGLSSFLINEFKRIMWPSLWDVVLWLFVVLMVLFIGGAILMMVDFVCKWLVTTIMIYLVGR